MQPSNSYPASKNQNPQILFLGAQPKFVDFKNTTYCT
eukprot:UN10433